MRVGFLATHCGNNTRRVFLFEDDKDSIVLVTEPQITVNLKSVMVGLAIFFVKAECLNSRQVQSLADSSFALSDWMLQGHLMARI